MGSTSWSDDHYTARATHRAATGAPTFKYDADIRTGKTAAKVNEKLDPKGVKFRESCDSEAHPNSRTVAVLFDVTGSMHKVPQMMQEKLPKLMGLLLRKGYLDHPHVLIGAVGDAVDDQAPLQVGQFESGIEIENDLTNLWLEGGGGGTMSESYELGMYFMSRHVKMDCLDKRNQKGYLFIIGDEKPYDSVKKDEVKKFVGDDIQANIPIETMLKELEEKFEVFFIIPNMTSHYNSKEVNNRWKDLLGQNVIKLEDPAGIAELIASTVGLREGKVDFADLGDDLKEAGVTNAVSKAVSSALVPFEGTSKAVKKAKGTELAVAESGAPSGLATI